MRLQLQAKIIIASFNVNPFIFGIDKTKKGALFLNKNILVIGHAPLGCKHLSHLTFPRANEANVPAKQRAAKMVNADLMLFINRG